MLWGRPGKYREGFAITDYVKIQQGRYRPDLFGEEAPTDTELIGILEKVHGSPCPYGFRPWRFIVIRDPANKDEIGAATSDPDLVGEVPLVIACIGDIHACDEVAEAIRIRIEEGAFWRTREKVMKQFASDMDLSPEVRKQEVVEWSAVAAERLCIHLWLGGWAAIQLDWFDGEKVRLSLDLPDYTKVTTIIAIGRARGDRPGDLLNPPLPVDGIVFKELYGIPFTKS